MYDLSYFGSKMPLIKRNCMTIPEKEITFQISGESIYIWIYSYIVLTNNTYS
jgi:hypothetical protein